MSSRAQHRQTIRDLSDQFTALAYVLAGNRTHQRLAAQAGLTVDRAALAALRALNTAPHPLRPSELAEILRVTAPHVTRQVALLADAGLVETARQADDQRARRVSITDEGRAAVQRSKETARAWLAIALDDFTDAELASAAQVIARVIDAYQEG
ncbi:MarR family transcriptional regulator [Streptomyces sp. NPDC051976]|uniref:MarR family winged helix-turn-helix transcriptional regulator n=1 Tax=Streptomyces sp. NPDC051976 TaxID=3154947 RepID=UPI00342C9BF1